MWNYLKTRRFRKNLKHGDAVKVAGFNHTFKVQTEEHDFTIMVYSVETSYLTVDITNVYPINTKTNERKSKTN